MLKKINQHHFAKQPLGQFPTPVQYLSRLTQLLKGPQLYIKRDDLTGLAFGGNKTRKLEFILGDALDQSADTLITAGAPQSNHCRQTAAAAASLGLDCHLLLGGQPPAKANGNLLLDKLFGARLHFCGEQRKGEDIPKLVTQLQQQGKKPYVVPYGGSNALGALAYVAAIHELQQQTQDETPFSHIIFASSSGGTHAGLLVGKALYQAKYEIIGINIDKAPPGSLPFAQQILTLANTTAKLVNLTNPLIQTDVRLNNHYFGAGYGIMGSLEREAIKLLAEQEGILLDPVYTGRAMGALIDMIAQGKFSTNDKILFWHTGGGPALFDYAGQLQN